MARDPDPAAILDAPEPCERCAALLRVRKLDEQRRLPVAAVRYQRIVGGELVDDRLGLEDALDAQHLLHLVLHRQAVLETERHVGPAAHGAALLVRDDLRTQRRALARVALEAEEVRGLELGGWGSTTEGGGIRFHRPCAAASAGASEGALPRARTRSGAPPAGNRSSNGRPPRRRRG